MDNETYFVKGFGLNAFCGHNAVVTWKARPSIGGQRVYDLTCACGATAVKIEYARNAKKRTRRW